MKKTFLTTIFIIIVALLIAGGYNFYTNNKVKELSYSTYEPSYQQGFYDGMNVTLQYLDSIGALKEKTSIQLEVFIEKENKMYQKRLNNE